MQQLRQTFPPSSSFYRQFCVCCDQKSSWLAPIPQNSSLNLYSHTDLQCWNWCSHLDCLPPYQLLSVFVVEPMNLAAEPGPWLWMIWMWEHTVFFNKHLLIKRPWWDLKHEKQPMYSGTDVSTLIHNDCLSSRWKSVWKFLLIKYTCVVDVFDSWVLNSKYKCML